MKVLITGGAGYMGSVATQLLLEAGHQVTVYDNLSYGSSGLLSSYSSDGFRFIAGDVRSTDELRPALRGTDAVVHLAAIVGDPACARQPELAREINQTASLRLFDLCREFEVRRFVFASTCSNYGKMADPEELATEESELRPVSLYAETKVAVEEQVLSSRGTGPQATVLRFATLFGTSPRMRFDLTVNEFTMLLATTGRLTVYGEQFWRPYVHVRDAARAIQAVIEAPDATVGGQVFNVGDTTQNFQKGELVRMIGAEVGGALDIEYIVNANEDQRDYRVSFEKISHGLGYEITRPVEEGIREVKQATLQGIFEDPQEPRYRN